MSTNPMFPQSSFIIPGRAYFKDHGELRRVVCPAVHQVDGICTGYLLSLLSPSRPFAGWMRVGRLSLADVPSSPRTAGRGCLNNSCVGKDCVAGFVHLRVVTSFMSTFRCSRSSFGLR